MGNMVIAHEQWGLPQSAREVFSVLAERGMLDANLTSQLHRMVGFRNIAVHEYDNLDMGIVEHVITHDIESVRRFASTVFNHYLKSTP